MPFAKGQSGNPGGRPKENAEVKALALANSVDALERIVEMTRSADEKIALAACNSVLDRAVGKPSQAFTGEDGAPLQALLRVEFVRPDQNT